MLDLVQSDIFIHLIDKAHKYAPDGNIEIEVRENIPGLVFIEINVYELTINILWYDFVYWSYYERDNGRQNHNYRRAASDL